MALPNGGCPDFIIKRITPAANKSTTFPSQGTCSLISGAMYPSVPRNVRSFPDSFLSNKTENPKSASFS